MHSIRTIAPTDNADLARVIRETMLEFGANKPGTVFFDPTTDHLYELFRKERSIYHVVEIDGRIVGGGGIYPTEGLPQDVCELVKFYLANSARGLGIGRELIQLCIDYARTVGYRQVYLETLPEFKQALKIYEKAGFRYIPGPMGNSGHFGCDRWMLLDI